MGINIGAVAGKVANVVTRIPGDLTPGFNIDSSAGGGIPFISKGNGSTGQAPVKTKSNTVGSGNTTGGSNTVQQGNNIGTNTASAGGYTSGGTGTANNIATILSQLTDQQGQIGNSGADRFNQTAGTYQSTAGSLLAQLAQGQANINNSIQQTEQDKIQSIRSLLNQVRQQQQSGAVNLSNTNALDSSAANVLSRATSNYANEQKGAIGAQEQAGLSQAQQDQNNLNTQKDIGLAGLKQQRDSAVDTIGNDVESQLRQLDYQANNVGLSGKIQIDAIKQQVVNDGLAKLNAIDGWLQSQLGQSQQVAVPDAAAAAYQQLQNGSSNQGNTFTYDQATDPTSGLSGSAPTQPDGAATSLLPLYLRSKDNQNVAA